MCFERLRSVWVICKCKITKTALQAQTDLGRSKYVWTTKMSARHHVSRARSALKNFSPPPVIRLAPFVRGFLLPLF
ncbi:hypothetical protein RHMOL_Rhmol06G0218700 [Rhododendron molle]|uniref:Uncharacterized protein n=1 Tax=Rhododendron molle TaxID=49168 RepID=A0ACC0NF69_RHOML|nr:hypothetical protein RHMOL_Rhmol06G0218700 [Rhododendron molle]